MSCFFFFFFNDTATTEIYTLSLHDALPIWETGWRGAGETDDPIGHLAERMRALPAVPVPGQTLDRSEEHTSELQSRLHLVCRLLLEKKKKKTHAHNSPQTAATQQRRLRDDT